MGFDAYASDAKGTCMRRIAGMAGVLVALAAGSGTAAACNGGGTRALAGTFAARHHGGFGVFGAAATYLNLAPASLQAQLASGKTLAQIATAQGRSVTGLLDAMVAAVKT